jgi:hypothetical protein
MADWDGNETSALRKIFGGSPWSSRGLVLYPADTRYRDRVDERLRSLTSRPWCKTQQPTAAGGMFTKADFDIDLDTDTVTCPHRVNTAIRRNDAGDGTASFGHACADCPLRASAPRPTVDAPSASAATNAASRAPAPSNRIRSGLPTTGPPAPKSNARSAT